MGKLEFKVGSLLKNIIGKDLITDDFIAIYELVKNSYDAHAKNVIITFEDSKIVIADNGKGMSLEDLKEKWLFVAYSAKLDGTEDEDFQDSYREKINLRKHYAGAKGIGRFSCDRLGRKLKISTQKINTNTCTILDVNWSDFENNPKEEFQNVTVNYSSQGNCDDSFPNNKPNGTVLEITELSGGWNRDKLLKLKHSLEKLINPFSESDDFSITINCKRELEEDNNGRYTANFRGSDVDRIGKPYIERDRVNGKIKNSILEILDLKTTQINVRLSEGKLLTELKDRGTLIYKIEEKNPFNLIDNLKMDLYYLNTSAKNNFTRKMGVQVVNFGSVFLFKNGFRVQPYGDVGDDSWGLDYRAQQGRARSLGTRELFGRVDITTDDTNEFAEVTSRDGGLVKTNGFNQLINAFNENALKRLERYVVGVLWGEGFKRRNYFGKDDNATIKAEEYRRTLLDKDKNADSIEVAKSNLGSKLDFIQIIKSLTNDKEIIVHDYNKEFIDLVNDNIEDIKTNVLSDLKQIAEKNDDKVIWDKLSALETRYKDLELAKEQAIAKAKEEEGKRILAEKKAKEEERKRTKAEQKEKEEIAKRKQAEEAKIKAENDKLKAENAQLLAEKKAREEKAKKEKAESEAKKRKEQVSRYKATKSIEYKDLEQSNHIIGVYADTISKKILRIKRKLDRRVSLSDKDLYSFLQGISLASDKILTLTRFTTKSNFLVALLDTTEDIVKYISEYINNTLSVLYDVEFEINDNNISFVKNFKPIDLCTALDNILDNSLKKKASKITYSFSIDDKDNLIISIKDIGKPLSNDIKNWEMIFEEGVTTTKGAGLGLANVKTIVEKELKGKIVYNPEYTNGFELLITLKK